jgi:hypothetical protein
MARLPAAATADAASDVDLIVCARPGQLGAARPVAVLRASGLPRVLTAPRSTSAMRPPSPPTGLLINRASIIRKVHQALEHAPEFGAGS